MKGLMLFNALRILFVAIVNAFDHWNCNQCSAICDFRCCVRRKNIQRIDCACTQLTNFHSSEFLDWIIISSRFEGLPILEIMWRWSSRDFWNRQLILIEIGQSSVMPSLSKFPSSASPKIGSERHMTESSFVAKIHRYTQVGKNYLKFAV